MFDHIKAPWPAKVESNKIIAITYRIRKS
jgi:hypothetical protein